MAWRILIHYIVDHFSDLSLVFLKQLHLAFHELRLAVHEWLGDHVHILRLQKLLPHLLQKGVHFVVRRVLQIRLMLHQLCLDGIFTPRFLEGSRIGIWRRPPSRCVLVCDICACETFLGLVRGSLLACVNSCRLFWAVEAIFEEHFLGGQLFLRYNYIVIWWGHVCFLKITNLCLSECVWVCFCSYLWYEKGRLLYLWMDGMVVVRDFYIDALTWII